MLKFLRRKEREDREKTRSAVRRTGQRWFRRVTSIFQRSEIDDDMRDELEEILTDDLDRYQPEQYVQHSQRPSYGRRAGWY